MRSAVARPGQTGFLARFDTDAEAAYLPAVCFSFLWYGLRKMYLQGAVRLCLLTVAFFVCTLILRAFSYKYLHWSDKTLNILVVIGMFLFLCQLGEVAIRDYRAFVEIAAIAAVEKSASFDQAVKIAHISGGINLLGTVAPAVGILAGMLLSGLLKAFLSLMLPVWVPMGIIGPQNDPVVQQAMGQPVDNRSETPPVSRGTTIPGDHEIDSPSQQSKATSNYFSNDRFIDAALMQTIFEHNTGPLLAIKDPKPNMVVLVYLASLVELIKDKCGTFLSPVSAEKENRISSAIVAKLVGNIFGNGDKPDAAYGTLSEANSVRTSATKDGSYFLQDAGGCTSPRARTFMGGLEEFYRVLP